MILCSSPLNQFRAHETEIKNAINKVLEGGYYIKGFELEKFEKEFAAFHECKFGVGVANGTDALRLALTALGVGPGDEVITVSHTAVATVAAIELAGATPILVDIEPNYFTLSLAQLDEVKTPKTKAIVAVHIYGQSTDMDQLTSYCRKNKILLIEDCAQSTGASWKGKRLGSFGDASCFSFYPTKNLGAIGDGGMVLTSQPAVAERVQMLREYGWEVRFVSKITGMNSRLDELQAAILRVKLKHLDADNQKRQNIAAFYNEALKGLPIVTPSTRNGVDHVHHLYVTRVKKRDSVLEAMRKKGVQCAIHYPMPVHQQPAYVGRIRTASSMVATEAAADEILSLPIYPELTQSELAEITTALKEILT